MVRQLPGLFTRIMKAMVAPLRMSTASILFELVAKSLRFYKSPQTIPASW